MAPLAALAEGRKANPEELYKAGSEYLQTLGFSNKAEIGRILDVAMNPRSLFSGSRDKRRNANARLLDVEEDMQPVVAFLESRGLSKEQILRVITVHPPVLCYDAETRLAPVFDYLSSLGIRDTARLIAQRPSLLGLDSDNNLRRVVGYLQETGQTPEQIQEMLEKSI
eukprot:jgi/Botrbrau1/1107/Bobra.0162s0008.1